MNSIQLGIIAAVAFLILITIGYYWYQEAKFKRIVENNFNYKSFDIADTAGGIILDKSNDHMNNSTAPILQKDIVQKNIAAADIALQNSQNGNNLQDNDLLGVGDLSGVDDLGLFECAGEITNNNVSDDSLEAIFIKLDKITFPYDEINQTLDYIVDIVFEEPKKIKFIPEVAQYTHNSIKVYVLDKNNQWHKYVKTTKYVAYALKIAVDMVNSEGVINHIQITNIYNELRKFVLQNNAHIRQSDYSSALTAIHNQIRHIPKIKLDLELFLILKDKTSYTNLNNFFLQNGFTELNGQFNFTENNKPLFNINDEYNRGLQLGNSYELLLITAKLHLATAPDVVIERIFDIAEKFMQQFESRLLTTNRQVFTAHDYSNLNRHIVNYVQNAEKNNIELGGQLMHRIQ
jgi:hypothetical protein